MSAQQIRAGEAFVEVSARDKVKLGLDSAMGKLKAFATSSAIFQSPLAVGAGIGIGLAFGAAIKGAEELAKTAVKLAFYFGEVAEKAKDTGARIAGLDISKGVALMEAWRTLQAVWGAIGATIGSLFAEPLTKALDIAIVFSVQLFRLTLGFVGVAQAVLNVAESFFTLGDVGDTVIGGILAALATADLPAAWGILTKTLEVMWDGVMIAVQDATISAFNVIIDTVRSAIQNLAAAVGTIETVLGVLSAKKLDFGSSSLFGAAGVLGEIKGAGNAGLKNELNAMVGDLLNDLASLAGKSGGAKNKLARMLGVIPAFNTTVGGMNQGGSAAGTFSGSAAALMGIGPGGGQKVSDDKTHDMLDRVVKAINAISVTPEFS